METGRRGGVARGNRCPFRCKNPINALCFDQKLIQAHENHAYHCVWTEARGAIRLLDEAGYSPQTTRPSRGHEEAFMSPRLPPSLAVARATREIVIENSTRSK